MQTRIKLSEAAQQSLRCPICKAKFELRSEKERDETSNRALHPAPRRQFDCVVTRF